MKEFGVIPFQEEVGLSYEATPPPLEDSILATTDWETDSLQSSTSSSNQALSSLSNQIYGAVPNETQRRLNFVAAEMSRRNHLGYGFGIGIGRVLGLRNDFSYPKAPISIEELPSYVTSAILSEDSNALKHAFSGENAKMLNKRFLKIDGKIFDPVGYASYLNKVSLVEVFLKLGAEPTDAIHYAKMSRNVKLFKMLIRHKYSSCDFSTMSPMSFYFAMEELGIYCQISGNEDFYKFLLDITSKLTEQDRNALLLTAGLLMHPAGDFLPFVINKLAGVTLKELANLSPSFWEGAEKHLFNNIKEDTDPSNEIYRFSILSSVIKYFINSPFRAELYMENLLNIFDKVKLPQDSALLIKLLDQEVFSRIYPCRLLPTPDYITEPKKAILKHVMEERADILSSADTKDMIFKVACLEDEDLLYSFARLTSKEKELENMLKQQLMGKIAIACFAALGFVGYKIPNKKDKYEFSCDMAMIHQDLLQVEKISCLSLVKLVELEVALIKYLQYLHQNKQQLHAGGHDKSTYLNAHSFAFYAKSIGDVQTLINLRELGFIQHSDIEPYLKRDAEKTIAPERTLKRDRTRFTEAFDEKEEEKENRTKNLKLKPPKTSNKKRGFSVHQPRSLMWHCALTINRHSVPTSSIEEPALKELIEVSGRYKNC